MTNSTAGTWVSLAAARRALGVSPPTLRRLIESGRISALEIPGGRPRVLRDDVVNVLAESTRTAKENN